MKERGQDVVSSSSKLEADQVSVGGIPSSISDLFNKPILHTGLETVEEGQPQLHYEPRPSDWNKENTTPKGVPHESFKRPSPRTPMDVSYGFQSKRAKSTHYELMSKQHRYVSDDDLDDQSDAENSFNMSFQSPSPSSQAVKKPSRSQSESALSIINAVEKIDSDPNLVGDGSKRHLLPILERGKHSDLKEISSESLVDLLNGKHNGVVDSYEVVDCRYPYEYNGGHIKGAINLHTQRQVFDHYMASKAKLNVGMNQKTRNIVIFHCEFSSQRGPDMCRYLRDCDRNANEYPSLYYPELYVLFGGYKAFFEQFKNYCEPQVYLPMGHDDFTKECRLYKSLSKTDVVNSKKPNSKTRGKPKSIRQSSMKKLCLDSP